MTRTVEQERADTIAHLKAIMRGCEFHAARRPDHQAMHDNTKQVIIAAIGDIERGIHEGEAG